MKKVISLLLLCSVSALVTAGCCRNELADQQEAFVERKRTELISEESELNAMVDAGIDEIVNDVAQDANIIRYTITLFKDRTKDSPLWVNILRTTILAASRANVSGETPVELIQELCNLLLHATTRGNEDGIVGDVTISMSDGLPTEGCCGGDCQCASRYNGNCPCSLDQAAGSCCGGTRVNDDMDDDIIIDTDDMDEDSDDYDMDSDNQRVTLCLFVE